MQGRSLESRQRQYNGVTQIINTSCIATAQMATSFIIVKFEIRKYGTELELPKLNLVCLER